MAEAAVSFAVQALGDLLISHRSLLRGLEQKVQLLKEDLQMMQAALRDAAEKQAGDESLRNWIHQATELALDAEDVIDILALHVGNASRERLLRRICLPNHFKWVEEEIESVRQRIRGLENSRATYGIRQDVGEGEVEPLSRRSRVIVEQQPLRSDDRDAVGLVEDVNLLLDKLTSVEGAGDWGLSTAAITGMAGIGKTTLARKVYNEAYIVHGFDCRAWAEISQGFSLEDAIEQILLQLNVSLPVVESDSKRNRLQMLEQTLHKTLFGRRYLIVLDDVWELAHWESLARSFPRDNASRCCLLITSRNKAILGGAHYVHEMKLLDPEQSWELFLKKVFGDIHCPEELEDAGKRIVERCHGLPLAISVAGGLLRQQSKSQSEWESFLAEIHSHLGTFLGETLELSYQNLAPHLKACFLRLSLFREDAPVLAEKLIHVWIAHRLVAQDEAQGRGTMEDIARGYLDELINRYMVQQMDVTKDGRVKTCQIHDLFRRVFMEKAKEAMNLEILKEEGSSSHPSIHPRHRAVYCNKGRFLDSIGSQDKRLRSLFVHTKGEGVDINPSSANWKSFKVIKVLDLEGCRMPKLPNAIGKLFSVRYLGLRNTHLTILPHSFSKLKNLQVLDLGDAYVKLPDFIWKIESLRHLLAAQIWPQGPAKICTLKNLQTLNKLVLNDSMMENLKEMTSLTKLGLILYNISDANLFKSLALLQNLACLNLKTCYTLPVDGLSTLRRVTRLKLEGSIRKLPGWRDFPPNLSCLTLIYTALEEDPMPVLEKLPQLTYLRLGRYAYRGEEMVFAGDGFPRLGRIRLQGLGNLRNISVKVGAMPKLQQWEIDDCPNLSNIDVEEGALPYLQRCEINKCPKLQLKDLPEPLRSSITCTG